MSKMKIIEELVNSPDNKMIRWVCDFQQTTVLNKALRHVKPAKVLITLNPDYLRLKSEHEANPKDHKTRYALEANRNFTINVFSKDDKLLKKAISFFGNHGGDTGLHVFESEEECVKKYNELVFNCIKKFERERELTINSLNHTIEDLKNSLIRTDYIMETLSRN